jgi:hypothetical protein
MRPASFRPLVTGSLQVWACTLSQGLDEEADEERCQVLLTALRKGSIVLWHPQNLHAEYDFSEEKLQDSVGVDLPKMLVVDVLP